jgi:serine protease inhibitor
MGTQSLAVLTMSDRPFVFLMRGIPTGTILFPGRVVDPNTF